jgi:hypothetical protein
MFSPSDLGQQDFQKAQSDEGSSNKSCKACRWDIDVGLRVYVLLIFRDEIRYLSHNASQTLLGLEQI